LSHVLGSRGFDSGQIRQISGVLAGYRHPRTMQAGVKLYFSVPDSTASSRLPDHIRIDLNPDSVLTLAHKDSTWIARVELVPFVVDTVRISGLIESSLWSARLGGDLDRFRPQDFEDLVYNLADILAWKVDFTRDLRRGDGLRVALERRVRP